MKREWWHDKIAYQIYPKSFRDTNGDGIGDLNGILEKLDYLKELGIGILWLSPVYPSPFVDQGYDISDYRGIAPEFGTMKDFDRLVSEAKKRDIRIVMDLVINHCSNRHPWFQRALQDPYGPWGGYFYFVKGKNGLPPSNLRSYFGGSAWEPVPGYEELYYLHYFAKEQPDLNWNNPALRRELYSMINWWLEEKGIAGFRIDAIINIRKDLSFPSYPPDREDGMTAAATAAALTPGIGEMLEDLKAHTFAPHGAFTVGEVFHMRREELAEFIGENGHFSTMFDFSAVEQLNGDRPWALAKPFDFEEWKQTVIQSQRICMGVGFLANIIENHDEPRGASTFLPFYCQNERGKKMLGMVSILLRGIPFLYQGQEIGMENCRMNDISEFNDVSTLDHLKPVSEWDSITGRLFPFAAASAGTTPAHPCSGTVQKMRASHPVLRG